jgi:protein-S-isoprenylcysteine O-methyltransferase Ste14
MTDPNLNPSPKPKLNRSGINRIFQVLASVLVFAAVLFGCAGRLNWWEAWAFLAIYLLGIMANAIWTLGHDPGVINERGQIGKNAKFWDRIITVVYTILLLVSMAVAGLDARFGWSSVPLGLKIIGALGFVLSMGLVFWVMTANTFLSGVVRIQNDRGHYTVTGGPYRYVRHPMYAGLLLFFWAAPLLLGSWWVLVPSALNVILFIIRTVLEDKTLQAELPGYPEYVQQVHYRLIPGVW